MEYTVKAEPFFAYARERYQILLNRRAGLPREQWTQDKVLQAWSFCNVFREDDKVTTWFRESIRGPMAEDSNVLFATIAFRWFNTIAAGEVMQPFLLNGDWPRGVLQARLEERRKQDGKIVTGAYIIKTPSVLTKIEALVGLIAQAKEMVPFILEQWDHNSLEKSWELLLPIPYMGQFTCYEVITDVRHTNLLRDAKDLFSWANPGPGCAAGLGELFYGDEGKFNRVNKKHREEMMELMGIQLHLSALDKYWPSQWPQWEMRDCEHLNCEYMKYARGKRGFRLKRRYK